MKTTAKRIGDVVSRKVADVVVSALYELVGLIGLLIADDRVLGADGTILDNGSIGRRRINSWLSTCSRTVNDLDFARALKLALPALKGLETSVVLDLNCPYQSRLNTAVDKMEEFNPLELSFFNLRTYCFSCINARKALTMAVVASPDPDMGIDLDSLETIL